MAWTTLQTAHSTYELLSTHEAVARLQIAISKGISKHIMPLDIDTRLYLTGFLLLAYIYTVDLQELDDVAVLRNIAKDTSWVRDRVKAFAIACALGFRREFDPRRGIAIRFDPRGHRGSLFAVFYRAQ